MKSGEKKCATHAAAPQRIDRVVQALTGLSRAAVRGLFDHGCVALDGKQCAEAGLLVEAGAAVEVVFDPKRHYKERPKRFQSHIFRLVYEDDDVLVVEKNAGFLTVPTEKRETNTLVRALHRYVTHGQTRRPGVAIVHRLDRETSGLLVFGKTPQVGEALKEQFEARKPLREYWAIVAGELKTASGTFKSYLATDDFLNQRSVKHGEEGKLAITHYTVVKTTRGATFVKVILETGRRNQIRVHFAEKGHPVLGDQRYRTDRAAHPAWPHKRLALHAATLGFKHPRTGELMKFASPMPPEFERFLDG